MDATIQAIRERAEELFRSEAIDLLIGYEVGTVPFKSRPFFIGRSEVIRGDGANPPDHNPLERLTWNSFCSNNIAAFLQKYFENEPARRRKREKPYPKIGVVVKGCDYRSIVALIKERQVVRENLSLIGIPCRGMIDRRRVLEATGTEVSDYSEDSRGTLNVTLSNGKTMQFDREEVLQQACIECRFPEPDPEGVDLLVDGEARRSGDGGYARIADFEAKSAEEKWSYFEQELSKCIRCNACRQACPTCWCKECFADHTDMKWIGVGTDATDTMIFQIIRVYHQAGRCVECDACYNACPMGVDLRTYTKKIVKDVDEKFGYLADFSLDSTPPLSTFDEQDSNSFITDPEAHSSDGHTPEAQS